MPTNPTSQSTSTASVQSIADGSLDKTFYIPDELLIDEILLRLPVKFLLRFRCVSKQWCSVIDSRKFFNKHLRRNIECNPNSGIIFRAYPDSKYLYLEDVESLVESTVREIADPIQSFVLGTECVASCNGLVCLWKDETDVLLWNPAMRKIRKIPTADNIPLPFRLKRSSVLGFGYDHLNDDYKVLRTFDSQILDIMVSVYSLKNNSWTRADDITNRIRLSRKFGVFANGSVYWFANNDTDSYPGTSDSDFLFAYDLGVERHRELPLPAGVNKTGGVIDKSGMALIVFDRCLALFDHYADSCTDIWLMNDNGVENSWSKLLSVEQPGILGDIAWPLAFSKTRNEFLFMVEEDKLVWYDRVRNEVKNITIHGFPILFGYLVYTESLVQLNNDFKSDRKQAKGRKLKQQENNMSDFLSTNFKLKL